MGSLSIGRSRIKFLACTSKRNTASMLQQAPRNLLMELDDRERNAWSPAWPGRDVSSSRYREGVDGTRETVIRTPLEAPNAKARWSRQRAPARASTLC